MADQKPLVLDADGTFLRTDMLLETFWAGLGKDPIRVIRTSFANLRNRAKLKAELAEIADIRADLLPVNEAVAELARESVAAGREVIIASASDISLVEPLAKAHGLSDRVFASENGVNLKGEAKAQALVNTFGEAGFDYAGNEPADRAIWDHAENALIVGDLPREEAALAKAGKSVSTLPGGWKMRDLIRAMRPHQWVKNILLLLPMIAAHDFTLSTLFLVIAGMAAFSFAASSIYIVNDLLDLEADRLHKTKCKRPFASGEVPILVGMFACKGLGILALGIGYLLGPAFFGVVALYMLLSLSYSLRLKRMRWIDIACLAGLYTLRVVAGAAASQVDVSGYLLVFIYPIFLTLGCVKRLTELSLATNDDRLPGRGYGRKDRGDLLNVAALGMFATLLIFFMYSFTENALKLYPSQWLLWAALIPMAAWLYRMMRLGYFGKQDYDPIVFAMRDKRGIGLLLITLALMFYAAGLFHQWFGF
ncbi:MAG: UbiA family prenyltransferase [Paracoccaceae bacterium]